MNMLTFDLIRAIGCAFLRVSQYFAIPPKLYKRSEAVARLVRRGKAELNRRRATSE